MRGAGLGGLGTDGFPVAIGSPVSPFDRVTRIYQMFKAFADVDRADRFGLGTGACLAPRGLTKVYVHGLGTSPAGSKHRCSPDSRVATRRTGEPQDRPGTQALLGGHEPGRRSILRDTARPASPIRKSKNHREATVKNPRILPRTRLSTKVSIETTRRVLLCHSSSKPRAPRRTRTPGGCNR